MKEQDFFYKNILETIYKIKSKNEHLINKASKILADTTKNKGLIYVFGTGHSSILATEIFYRPGGLLNIYPIFHPPLMVHKGPMRSSILERDSKILKEFMGDIKVYDNDTIIIISTSGINPVPIDVAIHFRNKGAKIIAISSSEYYKKSKTRHESGKYLADFADIFLDNMVLKGDTIIEKEGLRFGSLSTLSGVSLINLLMVETISRIINETGSADIIISGNTPGGLEHNASLVKKYGKRIKNLK